MNFNIIEATDSYKLTHHRQYPRDSKTVYSYFESRVGAEYPETVFFGLQYVLKEYLSGRRVTWDNVEDAALLSRAHFGNNKVFNYDGWAHVVKEHGGRLPLRIKAVPEGTPIPTGNVLMTVENTDPRCFWLTNAVESLLTHVWYTSTVATLSRATVLDLGRVLAETAHDASALVFMLHDFSYRGTTCHEAGMVAGAAHLINSRGTDTVPAIRMLHDYYGAPLDSIGYSVVATEHSTMTARGLGLDHEREVFRQLLEEYPTGIISVVGDSTNIYDFTRMVGSEFKQQVKMRDGKVVIRPDSVTRKHDTPDKMLLWVVQQLARDFGTTANEKGYRILDPHVGAIYGDSLSPRTAVDCVTGLRDNSFSAENTVLGMGAGMAQRGIDRDTQRFAFKASAIERADGWHDVCKDPVDSDKKSKAGRLRLQVNPDRSVVTAREDEGYPLIVGLEPDLLETVFENGEVVKEYTLDEVRRNAGWGGDAD